MDHTKKPSEEGAPPRKLGAVPRRLLRKWGLAVLVVGVAILLLLGTGIFSERDSAGRAFSSGWTLLILLVLLPCLLMPLMMMGRHRGDAAQRDRKDDGTGR
ncbi:hypothetical protein [Roseicella aerolata]|uniref:DUF2933 domain-containing protein n=1 Tax=Roseicella aerolata TaxID=2883479 RepID=A0A9X1IF60_9PROT|nr:hypothetical protein [Roseicella aerolata]MCB4823081.1 hypothetical protein [Roseicella aerolata]